MGIFFKIEDKKEYLHIKPKKHSQIFSFIPLILYLIVLPIFYSITKFQSTTINIILIILLIGVILFAIWMALEGIFYGFFLSKNYEKKGKKVIRDIGNGIKIYKK